MSVQALPCSFTSYSAVLLHEPLGSDSFTFPGGTHLSALHRRLALLSHRTLPNHLQHFCLTISTILLMPVCVLTSLLVIHCEVSDKVYIPRGYTQDHPRRRNLTTSMVGLKKKQQQKNGHIRKNLIQSGEPQRSSWGTQKKKKKPRIVYPKITNWSLLLLFALDCKNLNCVQRIFNKSLSFFSMSLIT